MWHKLDRKALRDRLDAFRAQEPGVLAVVGTDTSGRHIAAQACHEHLSQAADAHLVTPSRVAPDPVRQTLLAMWRKADQSRNPTTVSAALYAPDAMTDNQIVSGMAAGRPSPSPLFFVVDTIDEVAPLTANTLTVFRRASREARCHIVLFMREEARSTLPGSFEKFELRGMPMSELRYDLQYGGLLNDTLSSVALTALSDLAPLCDSNDCLGDAAFVYQYLDAILEAVDD